MNKKINEKSRTINVNGEKLRSNELSPKNIQISVISSLESRPLEE